MLILSLLALGLLFWLVIPAEDRRWSVEVRQLVRWRRYEQCAYIEAANDRRIAEVLIKLSAPAAPFQVREDV